MQHVAGGDIEGSSFTASELSASPRGHQALPHSNLLFSLPKDVQTTWTVLPRF